MHVVLALLPKTFKCCANPDVYIVDVAIEKWFGYVKKTTFMNEEDPGYSRLWVRLVFFSLALAKL